MIEFPNSLPNANETFRPKISHGAGRSKMESGKVRQRRKQTVGRYQCRIEWEFNAEQYLIFQSFVHYTLNLGAEWFNAIIMTATSAKAHKIRLIDGDYDPSSFDGNNWRVKANVDVQELELIDKDFFKLMSDTGMYDTSMADAIKVLVNDHAVTSPQPLGVEILPALYDSSLYSTSLLNEIENAVNNNQL